MVYLKLFEFDGVIVWLALYGNNMAVKGMKHKEALESTFIEGSKIVANELEHFLERRDRKTYLTVLNIIAWTASWSEIKHGLQAKLGVTVNDAIIKGIIDALINSMIIERKNGKYQVIDPILRRYLMEYVHV